MPNGSFLQIDGNPVRIAAEVIGVIPYWSRIRRLNDGAWEVATWGRLPSGGRALIGVATGSETYVLRAARLAFLLALAAAAELASTDDRESAEGSG